MEGILGPYLRFAGWLAPYITDTALLALALDRRRALASSSRARRAPCSTSTTGPIPSSPPRAPPRAAPATGTGDPAHQDPRRARHLQGLLHPRGRRARSPTELARRDRRAPPRARQRVRRGHRPAAALRLGRRGGPRYAVRINGIDTLARHQARRPRRLRDGEDLHGLPLPGRRPHRVPGGGAHLAARPSPSTRSCRAGRRSTQRPRDYARAAHQGARVPRAAGRADRGARLAGLHRARCATRPSWWGTPRSRAGFPRSGARSPRTEAQPEHGAQDPGRLTTKSRPARASPRSSPAGATTSRRRATARRRSPRPRAGLPSVVIIDLVMPEMDGLELLRALKTSVPFAAVILLTGQGSIDTAVTAMKEGAYDYLTKPVDVARLRLLIPKAAERARGAPRGRAAAPPRQQCGGSGAWWAPARPCRRCTA